MADNQDSCKATKPLKYTHFDKDGNYIPSAELGTRQPTTTWIRPATPLGEMLDVNAPSAAVAFNQITTFHGGEVAGIERTAENNKAIPLAAITAINPIVGAVSGLSIAIKDQKDLAKLQQHLKAMGLDCTDSEGRFNIGLLTPTSLAKMQLASGQQNEDAPLAPAR